LINAKRKSMTRFKFSLEGRKLGGKRKKWRQEKKKRDGKQNRDIGIKNR